MAKVLVSEEAYVDALAQSQPQDLVVVCERLFIRFEEDESPEELAQKVAITLENEPMLLGTVLSKDSIELLLDFWEKRQTSVVVEMHLDQLRQLRYLGFVVIEDNEVHVNWEARDVFYFSLKGKRMNQVMNKYDRWEKILLGMLYIYGIIDVYYIHPQLIELTGDKIDYPDLEEFLVCRATFWRGGLLLRSQENMRMFMASTEVVDRNQVFDMWNEYQDLEFKEYTREEWMEFAETTGIEPWPGVPELFEFLKEELVEGKYRSGLIVKIAIVAIQNGDTYMETIDKCRKMMFELKGEEEITGLNECVKEMYQHVPLYGLKGYSRNEMGKRKSTSPFQVIEGGKKNR